MSKISSNARYFFRDGPFLFLTLLHTATERMHQSVIAKQADITYSHMVNITKYCEKKGLVTIEKSGRIKVVVLTEKGQEMALHLKKAALLVE